MQSWNFTQKLCLVLGAVLLIHSVGGMVVNPDFAVGEDATSKVWLWMDWNGWHALSGIALWATSMAVSFRANLARLFAFLVVVAEVPLIIWMLFDERPLGLFVLPTTADLVFHAATVLLFVLAIFVDRDRHAMSVS